MLENMAGPESSQILPQKNELEAQTQRKVLKKLKLPSNKNKADTS